VATLEDAAEELVTKLRGLDSEIEESEHQLEDLRQRVDRVSGEVDQDWATLAEAVSSFVHKLAEQQEALEHQLQATGQGVTDAQQAVTEDGEKARSEIAEGNAQLEALGQHVTGLQPGIGSLATEAGETPARELTDQAHALEQELDHLLADTRAFLHDEVQAVAQLADGFHDHCQELHRLLTDEATAALQQAFDDWESQVDGLEAHVAEAAFKASHPHARGCVGFALDQCKAASEQQMEALQQCVAVLRAQLRECAIQAEHATETLVAQAGAQLSQELERAGAAGVAAVAALDQARQTLSSCGFLEV